MPLFFSGLVLGSGTYVYQETLYRSESCKRGLRRTAHFGPPGMVFKLVSSMSPTLLVLRSTKQLLSYAPSLSVASEICDRDSK